MATRKSKGDLAELAVAHDLLKRGHKIAIPYGEDSDYDLIADVDGCLHRIQVKYTESIDWIAVYDHTSQCCYYIDAAELGSGRSMLHLRLKDARNSQRLRVRFAREYLAFPKASSSD